MPTPAPRALALLAACHFFAAAMPAFRRCRLPPFSAFAVATCCRHLSSADAFFLMLMLPLLMSLIDAAMLMPAAADAGFDVTPLSLMTCCHAIDCRRYAILPPAADFRQLPWRRAAAATPSCHFLRCRRHHMSPTHYFARPLTLLMLLLFLMLSLRAAFFAFVS